MSTGPSEGQFEYLINQGASHFVAKMLNGGKSVGLIKRGIQRIVPDVSESVVERLVSVGQFQASAGRRLQGELLNVVGSNRFTLKPQLPSGIEAGVRKPIPIREIPVVTGIFGPDPEGDRVRIDVDIGFDPQGPTRFFQFVFPSAPTWRQLYEAARDRLFELAGLYPEKFPYAQEQLENFVIVSIVSAARAF